MILSNASQVGLFDVIFDVQPQRQKFFSEGDHEFLYGLGFPNVEGSDSSEDDFALAPRLKPHRRTKNASKKIPKDPAPSMEALQNEDSKHHMHSPGSSQSENSSLQFAFDDSPGTEFSDLHALDFFDSETEHQRAIEKLGENDEGSTDAGKSSADVLNTMTTSY